MLTLPVRATAAQIDGDIDCARTTGDPIGKRIERGIGKTGTLEPVVPFRSELELNAATAAVPVDLVQVEVTEGREIMQLYAPVQARGDGDDRGQSQARQQLQGAIGLRQPD